ncbi:MAG: asparaginase [Bacillota bacterium]
MSEILLNIHRGSVVENIIRGDLVVTDQNGRTIACCGQTDKLAYMRSAAKPIQALVGLDAGIVEAYDITEEELAVFCASHNGESFHVAAVRSVLHKIGLTEHDLRCGADYSYNSKIKAEMIKKGLKKSTLFNNCSGKHTLMLAVCQKKGWSIEDYYLPDHPLQQSILAKIAYYTGVDKQQITIGVDGCGVPVFAMPLVNMAMAYAKLANPAQMCLQEAAAAKKIVKAMTSYPHMIAGTGEFCTALMTATQGRIIGKKGSDGIYCSACLGGPAIAVKIEDGNMRALYPVMMSIYKQLELLSKNEQEALAPFAAWDNINCRGQKVGGAETVFRLEKYF